MDTFASMASHLVDVCSFFFLAGIGNGCESRVHEEGGGVVFVCVCNTVLYLDMAGGCQARYQYIFPLLFME